jgi:N-acylneuraminate cytidylyltransferase
VRDFCGRPIISYSIAAALASGCFDEVMVSTDDDHIASVAMANGAQVPFRRSNDTASDTATTADVLREVLTQYAAHRRPVRVACCLYPTAPFVTPAILREGYDRLLADPSAPGLVPVTRFSYPIQRALRVIAGRVEMLQPEHLSTRSQDLEPAFHDAGQFYWFRVDAFQETGNLFAAGTLGLELPESAVQDIDNEEDWSMAELKFKRLASMSRQ